MQVNTNGILSFGQPYAIPPTLNNSNPPGDGVPVIAPFYADIDTSFQGNISVLEVNDTQLVDVVLYWINAYFENDTAAFSPSLIYNVSWTGVRRYMENATSESVSGRMAKPIVYTLGYIKVVI